MTNPGPGILTEVSGTHPSSFVPLLPPLPPLPLSWVIGINSFTHAIHSDVFEGLHASDPVLCLRVCSQQVEEAPMSQKLTSILWEEKPGGPSQRAMGACSRHTRPSEAYFPCLGCWQSRPDHALHSKSLSDSNHAWWTLWGCVTVKETQNKNTDKFAEAVSLWIVDATTNTGRLEDIRQTDV